MLKQIRFFIVDYKRICGKEPVRMLYAWMNRNSVGLLTYRIDRGMFQTFGKSWQILRILLTPVLNLLQCYSNCDIHYGADIGPGIAILHPCLGVVISGKVRIGMNLTLTGGNVIGIRNSHSTSFVIGHNCSLGANAIILAPVVIGNNVNIGASSLVLHSFPDNLTVGGVPAKPLTN